MKKIVKIIVLLVVLSVVCSTTLMAAESVSNDSIAKLSADYTAAKDDGKKISILQKLIGINQVNSHFAFYSILWTATESDIPRFKVALKKSGTTELLLNFSPYLKMSIAPLKEKIKNTDMSSAEKLALQNKVTLWLDPLFKNLNELSSEIAVVASKNPGALVKAVEKIFIEKNGDDIDLYGPLLGLLAMKEEGADAFLKSIDSKGKSRGALVVLVKAFGPYAVIPSFKQLENSASTTVQKETASLVIFMFPDIEPVYDKVVEAYRHGRYFEVTGLKKNKNGETIVTLEDAIGVATSWWGNYLKSKYKNNKEFVIYAAKNHLKNSDKQERIIEFLASTNFGAVAPYLAELDFTNVSENSLDALINATNVLSYTSLSISEDYQAEKFNFLSLLFQKLDAKIRAEKKLIYKLSPFSSEYKELFVTSNVGIFTDDEKETIAFSCLWDDPDRKMPEDVQEAILVALRENASPRVMSTIEYVEKERRKH